jgi:tetratricopeptide (TPR) repeat protein
MSLETEVFVSTVTPEFGKARGLVSQVLSRLGFKPIVQEIFGTEAGDLREVLRKKIEPCGGLIQLIGLGYGAEPPVETEFGRVSYTQYEYLYARSKGKKTWLVFVGEDGPRDKPIEQLDLPYDPLHPNPQDYQAERRKLQSAYREARQNDGHLYHPITTLEQILLKVEQLRDELDRLREEERTWRAGVSQQLTELTQAQKITQEKIRSHLLESAEQTLNKELAQIAAEKGWQRRQQLEAAVREEHAIRLSRIDDLARSFAEIEGTGQTNDVLTQMSRVLAEEGVDEAIAYIASLRGNILDMVRARRKMAELKNRVELRPLLKSAELLANRNDFVEADKLLQDVLSLEPLWSEALEQLHKLQIDQGMRAISHSTSAAALACFRTAESTARTLLSIATTNPIWQSFLARSICWIGMIQQQQGALESAKLSFESYFKSSKLLTESDPGNAAWQRDLYVSQIKLGDLAVAQGNLPEAQGLFAEALRIAQRLAESDPGNAEWQRDLSVSLNKLGDLAVAQGNLPEAQRLFAESLRIAQRLAESDPGNAAWQRDLSVSLNKLGDLAVAQGNMPEAQQLFAESLRIRQRLAESDPGNAEWQRDLYVSQIKLGDLAVAQGNLPEAQRLFAESLRIAKRLAESDPGNAAWQRDLSVSLEKLGELAVAQGNLPEAQRLFAESLRIRQRLAESDPGNAAWQRDLSVSLNKLGNLAVAQGNLPEAQQLFAESLRIAQRLAESDPGNAAWQHDLSVSLNKLGDLAVAQGNLTEAQRLFGEDLRIAQSLAESDPGNAAWQRDLWVSHWRVADLMEKQKDARAIEHWQQAHDILAGLLARGLHVSPEDLGFLKRLKAKVDS